MLEKMLYSVLGPRLQHDAHRGLSQQMLFRPRKMIPVSFIWILFNQFMWQRSLLTHKDNLDKSEWSLLVFLFCDIGIMWVRNKSLFLLDLGNIFLTTVGWTCQVVYWAADEEDPAGAEGVHHYSCHVVVLYSILPIFFLFFNFGDAQK